MKKIVLHVGSGKAGSTSIQQALLHGRSVNSPYYTYPVIPNSPGNQLIKYGFCCANLVPKSIREKFANQDCQEAIKSCLYAQCRSSDNVIISSEFLFHSSVEEISKIHAYLLQLGFTDIHVLIYLRDPAGYYISSTQQALKKQSLMPLPQTFPYAMLDAIEKWSNIKPTTMTVREFDAISLVNGDVVQDFQQYLTTIGIHAKLNLDRSFNESMCSEVVQALQDCHRHMSNNQVSDQIKDEIIGNIRKLIRSDIVGGSKPKLKAGIVKYIHNRYYEEMQVLRSRYGIFDRLLTGSRSRVNDSPTIDISDLSSFKDLVENFDDRLYLRIKADHFNVRSSLVGSDRSFNPYTKQTTKAFWKSSVAIRESIELHDIWSPKWPVTQKTPIATVGSCFAQHISKGLQGNGFNWINGEQGPLGMTSDSLRKFNYGVFSFRTGNIYTIAFLKQWLHWALDKEQPPDEVWLHNSRFFDPFRPEIEPNGFYSQEELLHSRRQTLHAIRTVLEKTKIFIFTLGLTEGWLNVENGVIYPYCPGTHRGTYDTSIHKYKNYNYQELRNDLLAIISLAKTVNKGIRFLLTVSPVPLIATASSNHILVANQYSKSVLRAVAGDLSNVRSDVDYFPSYELIASHPFGNKFYDSNLRTVTDEGVKWVMRHFFFSINVNLNVSDVKKTTIKHNGNAKITVSDTVCEEELLSRFESIIST